MELQENSNVIINENYRSSTDGFFDPPHSEVLRMKDKAKNESNLQPQSVSSPPATTYFETLMHLFKGNIGPGMYEYFSLVKMKKRQFEEVFLS